MGCFAARNNRCIATLVKKQLLGEALIKEICEKTKESVLFFRERAMLDGPL
jgi:hypothetical protein